MLADHYLPPLIMILILFISIVKWVDSTYSSKDFRGISAIVARAYLLYAFIFISYKEMNIETIRLILRLGVAAILIDEVIFWLSFKIAAALCPILKYLKGKVNQHGK